MGSNLGIEDFQVEPAEMKTLLTRNKSNKESGPDDIPNCMFKGLADGLAHVLTGLFNQTLKQDVSYMTGSKP